MRIEVVRQIDTETNEVWSFHLFDLNAVFVAWHKETKPKGKRKWQITEFWDKYGVSNGQMSGEPILPEDIKNEALIKITERLRVFTWDEWKH